MRKTIIFCCLFFITACSSTIQTASLSKAYKTYGNHQFERTLDHTSKAENAGETTSEKKAELTFLKTQYGYLAIKKLELKR